jgi:hypothetical protein
MAREKLSGTAVVIASNRDPDVDPTWSESWRDDGLFGELAELVGGVVYEFTLEVTVPGHPTYQQPGVRSRVPSKAERISLLETHPIPLTLEVPVVVASDDAEKIAIDWKAFIALPDKATRLKAARERALVIARERHMAAMAAANPEHAPSAPSDNPAMAWAEAVRSGTLTRAEFDQNCMQLLVTGQLRNADYLAAEARLTAP